MDNNTISVIQEHRPSRADAVQNRELLLKTAQALFDEQGVEVVSMTAIAQAAGVGKGTLYRHFESKTDLCFALLDQDQRHLQDRALSRFRQGGDPEDNLRWFLQETLAFIERNGKFLYNGLQDRKGALLEHPAHFWWRRTIHQFLAQLKPDEDVSYFADVLYAMLEVRVYYFQRDILHYTVEQIHDGLFATLDKLIA